MLRPTSLSGGVAVLLLVAGAAAQSAPGVRLIGWTTVPPDARDKSGLSDPLPGGVPHDRLGGFGSAIASSAAPGRYIVLPDRGPANGLEPYRCRWHEVEITVTPGAEKPVSFTLVSTTLMSSQDGPLLGLAGLWNADPARARRFDPEGVRVLPDGNLLVSDEYGPIVCVFDRATGRRKRTFEVPDGFSVDSPATESAEEAAKNQRGRVTNHGFEGLALSPDGTHAFAMIQGSLIQDGGRTGTNRRMVEYALDGTPGCQWVFCADKPEHTVSELLALDDHRFLVLVRDSLAGPDAGHKKVVLIDTRGATDVRAVPSLPATGLPPGIRPVSRRDLIDFLDPALGLQRSEVPEKIEGLAFAPDLPTGERCLLVTSDNDFRADQPSFIWAFAIARETFADAPAITPK